MASEHWKDEPEEQDFPSAQRYLSLLVEPQRAKRLTRGLKQSSKLEHFMAKDILRASGLPLLPADDHEVAKDLHKVKSGEKLARTVSTRRTSLGGRRLSPCLCQLSP
jgi:hypothetical protein